MKIYNLLFLGLFLLLFSACTSHQVEPMMKMTPPQYVKESSVGNCDVAPVEAKEGSLFGRSGNPLFSDKKAMQINDIVTIVIDERAFQSSQGDKKLTDTSVNNLGGGIFGGTGGGVGRSIGGTINGMTDISFNTNSNNNFSASGTQSRNEKFKATITARVVRILNNGNYFVAGSRELLLNGTKQIVRITGGIRPYDIAQDNTIDSKYISDAKIFYDTEGDIRESTRKPWGSRMVESIWPF
jgi:flagellar L-ring protein precursor FlgH